MVMKLAAALLLLVLVGGVAPAQSYEVRPGKALKLLPGYQVEERTGIDAIEGTIAKSGGLTVRYDIGKFRTNVASLQDKDRLRLYKEHEANGRPVHVAFAKDGTLYVSFPDFAANFQAKVANEAEMAEALLMVLTYSPPQIGK
jgi:hypothetical protein